MFLREIHRSTAFDRSAKQLTRKQRDFEKILDTALAAIAASGEPLPGDRIPGLDGAPVYKLRLKYGNKGTRGGARLIYFCAEGLVTALFVYSKSDAENVQPIEIREALKSAGLLPGKSE